MIELSYKTDKYRDFFNLGWYNCMAFACENSYVSSTCWINKAIIQDIPLYCYTEKSLCFFSPNKDSKREN